MPNRLAHSTSPYLRQHADNPVDWYEWGPQALQRAKDEDKPILLSVGYSSCHWCHVMAHESFEDEAVAASMNERFINIKVDREERPDIDAIYQRVVQLMGEGGGWPLTVFLTPDQEPFYGGTYFPPTPRYGRPSFTQLLEAIHDLYHHDKERVTKHTTSFMEGFGALAQQIDQEAELAAGDPPLEDPAALRLGVDRLLSRVDDEHGGLGRQPKFPNPTALELFAALDRGEADASTDAVVTGARRALALVLERMYRGGIYDHLRGGFARYSVDRVWLTPHFEKMLYDNAQLLPLYAEASALHPEREHLHRVVVETIDYLEADMRTADSTFYAATDADSEGHEGKYFCWTPAEVGQVLGDEALASTFCTVYGVTERGNFEHGWSILNLLEQSLDERAAELELSRRELDERLGRARTALLEHRYRRVPPHRDDKILTSWNALLVSGLGRTAAALAARGDRALAERCEQLATTCLAHLLAHHVDADGRVLRAAFEGKIHTRGVLEDVAYLGRACLDLHELTLEPSALERARTLAEHAVRHHLRPERDGFYITADDAETLVDRMESQHDGPIPSGLGVMMELLLRLRACGAAPEGIDDVVEAVPRRFVGATAQPFGYASLLSAARHAGPEATHVTVRGPSPQDPQVRALAAQVRGQRLRLRQAVSLSFAVDSSASAVVCRQQTCKAPVHDPEALRAELSA
ncbi:thioredoxin domain-containing protein [Paraliomyxa miuraensis]|uniref:thioredoxin domain-containing protein n=1 Tax=Paraliomyxa miuraensis TaxID=376150 RepID=UPI00225A7382|nr:thioredoxin domain-containing protein [Paraliomyxa miuraensis]MCX4248047.1 thioredoxin domain-containing protein [Paraliomyxa miuraensis]